MVHTRLTSSAVKQHHVTMQQHYGLHPDVDEIRDKRLRGRREKALRVGVYCQSLARQVLMKDYKQKLLVAEGAW